MGSAAPLTLQSEFTSRSRRVERRAGRGNGVIVMAAHVALPSIDLLKPEPAGRVGSEAQGPGQHT